MLSNSGEKRYLSQINFLMDSGRILVRKSIKYVSGPRETDPKVVDLDEGTQQGQWRIYAKSVQRAVPIKGELVKRLKGFNLSSLRKVRSF